MPPSSSGSGRFGSVVGWFGSVGSSVCRSCRFGSGMMFGSVLFDSVPFRLVCGLILRRQSRILAVRVVPGLLASDVFEVGRVRGKWGGWEGGGAWSEQAHSIFRSWFIYSVGSSGVDSKVVGILPKVC